MSEPANHFTRSETYLLLEAAPAPLMLISHEGKIFLANAGAVQLTGRKRKDLIGYSIEEILISPGSEVTERICGGEKGGGEEMVLSQGIGEESSPLPVHVSWSPVEIQGGHACLIGLQDLSRRVAAEEALREHAAELERSLEDLELFARAASHDLREPLHVVTSFLELIDRRHAGELGDEVHEYVGHALEGARRLSRILENLQFWSRAGREIEKSQVDLEEVVAEALANLEDVIEDELVLENFSEPPYVLGDHAALVLVFQNLLSNASRFRGEAPPKVELSSERVGDHWILTVRDNGVGIPEEHQEAVFEPFRQCHGDQAEGGTGMGLALIRRILERHDGSIEIAESAPGEGTAFRITLPAG